MLHIKFTSKPLDKQECRLAVVTTFLDCKPLQGNAALLDWRLNGRLSRLLMANRFTGQAKEMLLMPSEGRILAKEILVVGLGAKHTFDESQVAKFVPFLLDILNKKKTADFVMSFSDIITDHFEWRNGIRLLVSKLSDCDAIKGVKLCEREDYILDAKRRHMDFGMNVEVSFDAMSL